MEPKSPPTGGTHTNTLGDKFSPLFGVIQYLFRCISQSQLHRTLNAFLDLRQISTLANAPESPLPPIRCTQRRRRPEKLPVAERATFPFLFAQDSFFSLFPFPPLSFLPSLAAARIPMREPRGGRRHVKTMPGGRNLGWRKRRRRRKTETWSEVDLDKVWAAADQKSVCAPGREEKIPGSSSPYLHQLGDERES